MNPLKLSSYLVAILASVCLLSGRATAAAPDGWSTDLAKALVQAKTAKKTVLLEFTGSDWCEPCLVMRKAVFSKPTFVQQASKDFILVELDVPRGDKALAAKNQPIADKYKIARFPTIILLHADGKEVDRFFASDFPSEAGFFKRLKQGPNK